MTVFTCSPDVTSMMTCIYEAYASRLGHRNIRLQLEPLYETELFCEYQHIDADESKAASVIRSIKEKISWKAWIAVYRAAMSFREDRLDCIYRFLLLGFHYGSSITDQLQHPAVSELFIISRKVMNEAHLFREFTRFSSIGNQILVSHIEPKCDVLSLIAPAFEDRMPSEHWMIIDDLRKTAVVHPADQSYYITSLTADEFQQLRQTENSDQYTDLWKEFFESITIQERSNQKCQRTMMPIWYRKHMTEFR